MNQRLVLLDANLIIAAYDTEANVSQEIKQEAHQIIGTLSNDASVKFVTTPLIRFEVLCGVRNEINFTEIKELLDDYKLFELTAIEADEAIEIYKLSRQKNISFKDPVEPKKYKFDLFHVASAKVNGLELQSPDSSGAIKQMKQLSSEVTK
jgi:predicted nucleic acid-binding protein